MAWRSENSSAGYFGSSKIRASVGDRARGMAPGNIDRESETRNSNANYNRDKPRKPFLRMSTNMQNKIENVASGTEPNDDFSLDLLDEAQMARLKRAFCIFDKDDSGKISHQEMMGVRPRGRPPAPSPT